MIFSFLLLVIPKEEFIQETSENELLWSANELYKYKDGPVLPVRPTTRRGNNYFSFWI